MYDPFVKIGSLYVHFPFCESKCHYCDFYSLGRERTREGDPGRFEGALNAEAAGQAHLLAPELETIFFGGGTPSLTPASSMARALSPVLDAARATPRTEWTMEANPSSITLESMREYRALGINRISMGVQALRPDLLSSLGRVHSRETALAALSTVFEAGFDNVSVDLLCGAPGQSQSDVEEALRILTSFPITHLSCYLLTLPPHHRMFRDLPDEDTQLSHLLLVDQWMRSQGFEHYEISNFAKPGRKARHNLNYWTGRSYLGLGPSAHSFDSDAKTRWKNVSSIHKYATLLEAKASVTEWTETLTPGQIQLEQWMLALRLDTGFPVGWLKSASQKNRADAFQAKGLIERHPASPGNLRLTPLGFALSDQIISALAVHE